MNCNPYFLEIWDIPDQSVREKVSLNETVDRAYFSSDEERLFVFTDARNYIIINVADGKIIKTGNTPGAAGSGTVIAAIHPSDEWFALGVPGEIVIGNLETDQIKIVPVGEVTDLTEMIAPQITDTINELETNPELQASIGEEWKERIQAFAKRPFLAREYIFSLAFCNRYLCCGTSVGVRAFPWETIITSQATECPPRFAYLRDDWVEAGLNETVMSMCPDPKRNRLLFGQGGKLCSMNLTDGKVMTLTALPSAARITRIEPLGGTTFALEVWVSFPHYGRNTNPRYLYIIDLDREAI